MSGTLLHISHITSLNKIFLDGTVVALCFTAGYITLIQSVSYYTSLTHFVLRWASRTFFVSQALAILWSFYYLLTNPKQIANVALHSDCLINYLLLLLINLSLSPFYYFLIAISAVYQVRYQQSQQSIVTKTTGSFPQLTSQTLSLCLKS